MTNNSQNTGCISQVNNVKAPIIIALPQAGGKLNSAMFQMSMLAQIKMMAHTYVMIVGTNQ